MKQAKAKQVCNNVYANQDCIFLISEAYAFK